MLLLTSGDQDLWAYARSVEREYGEGAFLHAALKVDRYEARGMRDAAALWRKPLALIEVRNSNQGLCEVVSAPQRRYIAVATWIGLRGIDWNTPL